MTHQLTSYFVIILFKSFSVAFRLSAPYPLCLYLSPLPSHPFICLPVPSRRTVAYPGHTFHFTCIRYFNVTLATDLPHSSVIVYKGLLLLLCSLVCNLVL